MEKGFRNLQSITRIAHKIPASGNIRHDRGSEEDDEGDSGICCSDAEMEVVGCAGKRVSPNSSLRTLQPLQPAPMRQIIPQTRPLLPLYQPPTSAFVRRPTDVRPYPEASFSGMILQRERHSGTPDSHNRSQRGVSIQSMLSHAAPSRV